MSTDQLLHSVLNFIDQYELSSIGVIILSIVLLNMFFPASIIIGIVAILFNEFNGPFISFISILIAAQVPYFLVNTIKFDPFFLLEKYNSKIQKIILKESTRAQVITRLITLPFIVQNFICAKISKNIIQYSFITGITSIPWIIMFSFFASAIKAQSIWFVMFSVLLIIGYSVIIKRKFNERF